MDTVTPTLPAHGIAYPSNVRITDALGTDNTARVSVDVWDVDGKLNVMLSISPEDARAMARTLTAVANRAERNAA